MTHLTRGSWCSPPPRCPPSPCFSPPAGRALARFLTDWHCPLEEGQPVACPAAGTTPMAPSAAARTDPVCSSSKTEAYLHFLLVGENRTKNKVLKKKPCSRLTGRAASGSWDLRLTPRCREGGGIRDSSSAVLLPSIDEVCSMLGSSTMVWSTQDKKAITLSTVSTLLSTPTLIKISAI